MILYVLYYRGHNTDMICTVLHCMILYVLYYRDDEIFHSDALAHSSPDKEHTKNPTSTHGKSFAYFRKIFHLKMVIIPHFLRNTCMQNAE